MSYAKIRRSNLKSPPRGPARICPEWIVKSSALKQRRLPAASGSVEHRNLNPPAGLRASHERMGDVSTIPEAGQQNPGSDKTLSSSASQDSTQPGEFERVTSLETALVRALQCLGEYDSQTKRAEQT